jgi:hypothetical protein
MARATGDSLRTRLPRLRPGRGIRAQNRRGAVLVETAFILPLCLLMVAAIVDLCMAMHHRNVAAWVARESARHAVVHGSSAAPKMVSWGPAPFKWSSIVRDDSPQSADIVQSLEPFASYLNDPEATVEFEWPNESNHWGDTVRVTVRLPRRSLFPALPGFDEGFYSATCTMQIAH